MSEDPQLPAAFKLALLSIRQTKLPPHLVIEEIPLPHKETAFGVAISARTKIQDSGDKPAGIGRFALFYDYDPPLGWDDTMRCVIYVESQIDMQLATDSLAPQVAWSWLTESLINANPGHSSLVGTVSVEVNQAFGGLTLGGNEAQIQIRASWSPQNQQVGPDFTAWLNTLLLCSGLDPAENVIQLRRI